jgi:hypothetical protein
MVISLLAVALASKTWMTNVNTSLLPTNEVDGIHLFPTNSVGKGMENHLTGPEVLRLFHQFP